MSSIIDILNKRKEKSAGIKPLPDGLLDKVLFCPFCHSRNTEIRRYDNAYPFWHCNDCQVEYMEDTLLSQCNHPQSFPIVSREDCEYCNFSIISDVQPCKWWGGLVTPPEELRKHIKEEKEKLQKQNSFARKVV